jgi:hypothetical protein
MVHAESGLTTVAQIQSGTVAIEAGSPFQQYLWTTQGWEGKVAMVPTAGGIGAFAADPKLIQQGYVTSEPCVAEGQGLHVNFIPSREFGWNPYASLAVVRGTEKDQPWVKAFADASKAGWTDYIRDPTRADIEINRLNPDMPLDRSTSSSVAQFSCSSRCIRAYCAETAVGSSPSWRETRGIGDRWDEVPNAEQRAAQTLIDGLSDKVWVSMSRREVEDGPHRPRSAGRGGCACTRGPRSPRSATTWASCTADIPSHPRGTRAGGDPPRLRCCLRIQCLS